MVSKECGRSSILPFTEFTLLRRERRYKPVDECEEGILRSLGEGGYASEGFGRRSAWRGATGRKPVELHFAAITRKELLAKPRLSSAERRRVELLLLKTPPHPT
jgi:hypothetical protein